MKAKGGPVPQEILSLRCDQEAAATLMREAAADYAKQQDMAKARAIYQSIVTSFPEKEYGPIRRAAESALTQLNDMEKEAK